MSQNIELEYKTLLTKEQFEKIKSNYPFLEPKKQVNHYFDTDDKKMKARRSPLRIREIDDKYILTLKKPNNIGVLEYECEVQSLDFANNTIPNDILEALGDVTPNDVHEYGALTTYRSIFETELATICLDENFYVNEHDYEIEYEVKKEHDSLKMFKAFMYANGINNPKPAPGKASRFRKAIKF